MSHKSKGINAERDLIHKFWATNRWSAVRVAGSGSMRYPSADIIASDMTKRLAIECKATKDSYKHFEKQEIQDLERFAKLFDAEPYIAIKFKGQDWFFLRTQDLEEKDRSFRIDLPLAKSKGVLFEALINL